MVRLTDRPDMTLDVYRGRKTTMQQQQHIIYRYTFYAKVKKWHIYLAARWEVSGNLLNCFEDDNI